MTFVDHRYLETGKFKHKADISIIEQTISNTGRVTDGSSQDFTRWFAYMPETGLSRGFNADSSVEPDTGLQIMNTDLQIVIKYSQPLMTAFLDKKKIQITHQSQKYNIVSAVNVGGEGVYLSLGLKRTITNV